MIARKILVVACIALGLLSWGSEASAQAPYSPYIGMFGSGNRNGLMNRYLDYQSQSQTRQAFQAQSNQIQTLTNQVQSNTNRLDDPAETTGHKAMFMNTRGRFMNYSHYFGGNTSSGGQVGIGGNRPSSAQAGMGPPRASSTTAYRR